ncbi:MAG: YncE family protein [Solirubrobacteraceae bacterium]
MSGRRAAVTLAVALAVAGCGGTTAHRHRAGAEPAVSPVPAQTAIGRSVTVGALAEGIVADPAAGLVAVAVRRPNRIVLIDAHSGAILRRLLLAGPARHLGLAGAATLLVPEAPVDRLLQLPLTGRHFRSRSVPVASLPHDAAAVDGRVFVADEFGRAVSVISHGREIRRIGGFTQPGGIAAVGKDVAVVDVGADAVTLIDARTLRVLGRAPAGAGISHVVAGRAGRFYVADTRGGALLSFTARPRLRLLSRVPVPGRPYGLAIDTVRNRLWLTVTAADRVEEFDVGGVTPRRVGAFPTARQPNTVAVDPTDGRVFIAAAASGTVQIFDPPYARSLR